MTIRSAGSRREDAVTKALGEDLAAAEDRIAPEAPDQDLELNASAAERKKVLCSPAIPASDLLRDRPTIKNDRRCRRPSPNNNTIAFDRDPVDHQSCGNQAGWLKSLFIMLFPHGNQQQYSRYLQRNV